MTEPRAPAPRSPELTDAAASSTRTVEILEADLTWTGDRFESGVRVVVSTEGDDEGWITAVGSLSQPPTRRLRGKALLPGLVNVHSHSFQRGLRGRGETFPAGAGSFWSWREAMYELAGGLDREGVFALAKQAFSEMRRAGITTVGEFHYLHHELHPGATEAHDYAFDEAILQAGREVGIRLVLLQAYYRTGGIGQPLQGAQHRFETPDLATYWRQMDHLATVLDPRLQSLGAVAHSIRAVPLEEVAELWAEARRRGLVMHMHVEEQRQEIEACLAAHGKAPTALLCDRLGTLTGFTSVHCTHTAAEDMERFLAAGGTICICPLTEGNLGDGIADLPGMHARASTSQAPTSRGGTVCLGSDSNARISMLEEMRWLEYVQRLARERRGILRSAMPDRQGEIAAPLLATATTAGARSLALPVGAIAPRHRADFALVDLEAPTLAGATPETLAAALVLGCGEEVIAGTCVGGVWRSDPASGSVRSTC